MRTKSERVEFRVSAEELHSWREQAESYGMSLSDWIRRRCNGRDHKFFAKQKVEHRR